MANTEMAANADSDEARLNRSWQGLSTQVQKYLGSLLSGVYTLETFDPTSTHRFSDILSKLERSLEQARDRDDVTTRELLLSVTPSLRRFALSLTHDPNIADDLVQDALLRAWKNRASFTPGTNFEAWTFTILRNQLYSNRRKHREVLDEEGIHAARLTTLPDQVGWLDLQDVQRALANLPPPMREALILVTVEGLSYDETATIMGCELGTAKSRVWRARNKLARLLGYDGDDIGNDAVMLSAIVEQSKVAT